MEPKSTKEIYSSMDKVWPDNSPWYDHTHSCILDFIYSNLSPHLHSDSLYLNAGSGGSEYALPGTCHHVDIVESLIRDFELYTVASIEQLPFAENSYDAAICVGSVLNYCDAVRSIHELCRVIKPNGYLVLEFERSHTGELWFDSEYGKNTTKQKYEYMEHTHTLWLYSEKTILNILENCGVSVIKKERFHCLSSLANRIIKNEEHAGKYSKYDFWVKIASYYMAHNMILLCKKL